MGRARAVHDTPVVSATLRVRLRSDPAAHAAGLACIEGDEGLLVCTKPACVGGKMRIAGEGGGGIAVSVGGPLKNGRFIGHYIHPDGSCGAVSAARSCWNQGRRSPLQSATGAEGARR